MQQKPNRNRLFALIIAIIIVLGLAWLLIAHSHHPKPVPASKTTSTTVKQVVLQPSGIIYPTSWQEASEIPATDKQAGVISEASTPKPSTTVIVRKVVGELSKNFNINTLPAQAAQSLAKGVSGFSLVNKAVTHIGSYPGVQIDYTLKSANGQTYHDEMFIIPTQHATFYATYSTNGGSLAGVANDITTINTSLASYIKTHAS